jgi:DNA polymerase III sliding clamp (beta) subunit (PCNA family)
MNRRELLQTLELVAPALAQENLMPMFQNFCFKRGVVIAYRDSIGVIAPSTVDYEFAVHGKTLIELLRATAVKDVEIELQNECVLVKAGRSKIKLPFSPASEYLFEEPEQEKWELMLDIDKYFLKGMELCLSGTSNNNTMPALMGISIAGGKDTYLYSCDGDSISRYRLDQADTAGIQYIMPNAFCEALLKVTTKTGHHFGQLYVNGQWVVAELSNAYRIFGRIIDNPEPLKFEAEIAKTVKEQPVYVGIPNTLTNALNRAQIIGSAENKATDVHIENGKITLTTETHMGVVRDIITLKGGHQPIEVKVDAKLMSRAISVTDEFAIQENCTMYNYGEDFFLIMSNIIE